MINKSELMKKWNELSPEEKQKIGFMAGFGASLFVRGLLRYNKKEEVIKLVVPKDADVVIFVKGGK